MIMISATKSSERRPTVLHWPRPRRQLARTLGEWRAPTRQQAGLRRLYVDHLAGHPDGWSRHCRGAHLTASSLICAPAAQKVLLTLHARLGRWLQTGGHLETTDQTIQAAAMREAAEESGLQVLTIDPEPALLSRHEVPCSGAPTFHLDVQFLVLTEECTKPAFGAESIDVQWFRRDQLPGVDDSVTSLVAAAGCRLGWDSSPSDPAQAFPQPSSAHRPGRGVTSPG